MRTFICLLAVLTHTHAYTSPYEKILATWFGRGGHPFSSGCTAHVTVRSTCPLTTSISLCSFIPVSKSLIPPCLAGWNIHLTQAPNFMAEPEEGVDSLHCNHGNTFQRCSLQSSWVFPFSTAALFLRGYVYHRNKRVAKHLSHYSVKYILPMYKTSWALNKMEGYIQCCELHLGIDQKGAVKRVHLTSASERPCPIKSAKFLESQNLSWVPTYCKSSTEEKYSLVFMLPVFWRYVIPLRPHTWTLVDIGSLEANILFCCPAVPSQILKLGSSSILRMIRCDLKVVFVSSKRIYFVISSNKKC